MKKGFSFMKIKRIIGLLLIFSVIACMLTSCSETPAQVISKADKALTSKPYQVDMDMELTCGDKTYGSIFEGMENDVKMFVDGENFSMELDMMGMKADVIFAENTAYFSMSMFGQTVKQKAAVTELQRDEIFEDYGATSEFKPSDFTDISMETNDDGDIVITCTGIKTDVLSDYVDKQLEDMGMGDLDIDINLAIDNVALEIVIDDGKYESLSVSMTMNYDINGEEIEVGAEVSLEFDYEAGKAITPPADKDEYEEASYDDIFAA